MEEIYLLQSTEDPNLFLRGLMEDGTPIRTIDKNKAIHFKNEDDANMSLFVNESEFGIEYSALFDVAKFVKEDE